jgi:hypothetical protein
VADEPTKLPEGAEVDLLPLDPGDWLDPVDRAALHRALAASQEDVETGRLIDAEEVLRELGLKDAPVDDEPLTAEENRPWPKLREIWPRAAWSPTPKLGGVWAFPAPEGHRHRAWHFSARKAALPPL